MTGRLASAAFVAWVAAVPCMAQSAASADGAEEAGPQSRIPFTVAEEKFEFRAQWSTPDGIAYRLYAPRTGSGSKLFYLCEIKPNRGTAFAPDATCQDIK